MPIPSCFPLHCNEKQTQRRTQFYFLTDVDQPPGGDVDLSTSRPLRFRSCHKVAFVDIFSLFGIFHSEIYIFHKINISTGLKIGQQMKQRPTQCCTRHFRGEPLCSWGQGEEVVNYLNAFFWSDCICSGQCSSCYIIQQYLDGLSTKCPR